MSIKDDDGQKRYQIAISQDGKYAVTFDAATLQIKILKNTDHREFDTETKNVESSEPNVSNEINESSEINKPIAHFELHEDLSIYKFYTIDGDPTSKTPSDVYDRWSIDISNIEDENFIFIAASRIDKKFMKKTGEYKTRDEKVKMIAKNYNDGDVCIDVHCFPNDQTDCETAIYCLKLEDEKIQELINYNRLSGICKFVPKESDNDIKYVDISKKFILLNYNGIYSFEYNKENKTFNFVERFNYPKIIMNEIEEVSREDSKDCMNLLLSHINKKYFLIEEKNGDKKGDDEKVLEVYDLENMQLETSVNISIVDDNEDYKKVYSIDKQKLQICFSLGPQTIGIFLLEHGSEIATRKFEEINNIQLIEFINSDEKLLLIGSDSENDDLKIIIWDIYDTNKVERIPLELSTCLASTSGNLLQVNDEGKVTSILKMIEEVKANNENNESKSENPDLKIYDPKSKELPPYKNFENQTIYFYEKFDGNFKPAIEDPEPWVSNKYKKISFCLYYDGLESLQLIVEPFLEFIWTNGIPDNQKNEHHYRLHIANVRFGLKYFRMEVYWYEKESDKGSINEKKSDDGSKNEKESDDGSINENDMSQKMENKKNIKGMIIKEKIIEWNDINDNANGIRYACEALESLNMRAKSRTSYFKLHKYHEIVKYINNIVGRFTEKRPRRYRLLDVRYRIMKNLILGDCDHLIHCLLFGFGTDLYIPKRKFWYEERKNLKYIIIDEDMNLRIGKKEGENQKTNDLNEDYGIYKKICNFIAGQKEDVELPTTDVNLAIFHFRDRKPNDTIIITYILKYYVSYAENFCNLLKMVSDTFYLLNTLKYEECIRVLKNESNTFEKDSLIDSDASKDLLEKFKLKFTSPEDDRITKFQRNTDYTLILKNILLFIFIPRWYNNKDRTKYENVDDIFDLPDIEKTIQYRWPSANNDSNSTISEGTTNSSDNPFSTFPTTLDAAYFWTNGNWIQRELFKSWSVEIFTIITSLLIVIILQNMLIAIMGNVYESAADKSKQAVLKYKAIQISDYDKLHHRFDFWYRDPKVVPSKKSVRKFIKASHQDKYISGFATDLDYDQYSIWRFDNEEIG
ncbi:6843_t:CDS:10 [Funneliformis mosseae]|uniref:6843_t:CDS:1 n=1 Tax=Funneliformis mosseae TaxID=27381 RepID=A0A9N8VWX5_FUNMO|nr:6843_t:CDS:10 [Funneliformis mosseae]